MSEGLGESFTSVEISFMPDQYPDFSDLGEFLLNAHRKGIVHSWTAVLISEMLIKLINNNSPYWENIGVKLIQGDKTFLYASLNFRIQGSH